MKKIILLFTLLFTTIIINSQTLHFKYEKDSLKQSQIISTLAKELLTTYKSDTLAAYFDNKFRIEIVANQYQEAMNSLDSLRAQYKSYGDFANIIGIHFETYIKTKIKAEKTNTNFTENYKEVFEGLYSKVDERLKDQVSQVFDTNLKKLEERFANYLLKIKDKEKITVNEARRLCRLQASLLTYKAIIPFTKPYFEEQDSNFIIQDSIMITTRGHSKLSATLIRPKKSTKPLPAIFVFNIYAGDVDKRIAKRAAKNGYAGIVVNTRGKRLSPQDIEPFEHDANDAYDIITWISEQPWSNGNVGMYGGSYLGFSQWASVKHLHPALKTIVPQVAVGIGIDFPMHNNIFTHYMYQWIHYVENNKTTDLAAFSDTKKWSAISEKWYKNGLSFRSLDSIDGRPNKTFQKWLNHPSYDAFWQNMTPQKEEFANINIPILSITGYFDGDQRGALYYFNQHYKYNPKANHYLLIGPYDHPGAQDSPTATVQGYKIDSVANIDIGALVYQWFDYVLKGGKKPTLIKDKINYQVMGTNTWKHAASLKEINNGELTFYLDNKLTSAHYSLATKKSKKKGFINQTIDFKDRSDLEKLMEAVKTPPKILETKRLDSLFSKEGGTVFISSPFESAFEINGSFTGQLNLKINKKDVDISIALYEITPDNKFFNLSTYLGRASYARDKSKRQLLKPNKKESIPVSNTFLTSKKISKGSRLLLAVSVIKSPFLQINYGTGKDVSDETIKDAEIPLQIKWYNDSFVKIPIKKNY